MGREGFVESRDLGSITEVCIVDVSANGKQVRPFILKVESTDCEISLHILIVGTDAAQSVTEGAAIVAADREAQTMCGILQGIVVESSCCCIAIGYLELVWRGSTIMHEALRPETF